MYDTKEWRVQLDEWEAEWRAEFIAKSGFEVRLRIDNLEPFLLDLCMCQTFYV